MLGNNCDVIKKLASTTLEEKVCQKEGFPIDKTMYMKDENVLPGMQGLEIWWGPVMGEMEKLKGTESP